MWQRVVNASIALAVTLVAYQVYSLTVTPLCEPSVALRGATPASDEDWREGAGAVARYQELLRHYFPAGHWSLVGAPKIVESGQGLLVLDDYKPDDRGRVVLTQCAVIVFPTPRSASGPPPRDAIVFETAGGATLQFDNEFNPTRGKIGKPIGGYFPGELVIRSDMREPGPDDDLLIVTRDLRLDEAILSTEAPVSFRLGPHHGGGRRLEVRLLRDNLASPGGDAEITGVASLEISDEVQVTISLPEDGFGIEQGDRLASVYETAPAAAEGVELTSAPMPIGAADGPLTLTSVGPFRFDFTTFIAAFLDDVRATRPLAAGPSDQLFCAELRLHFAGGAAGPAPLTPADEPDLARAQGRILQQMTPYLLEALGNPVRLDSPSRYAAVRGQRLRVWVAKTRFRVDGAPATVAFGLNEAQAAWIDYRVPPATSAAAIGKLMMAGPGSMRVAPDEADPQKTVEARWGATADGSSAVRLVRNDAGQPILSLAGSPQVAAAGLGRVQADGFLVRLREVPADGPEGPAVELGPAGRGGVEKLAILPERIDGTGNVRFKGRDIEGATDRLVAWFRPVDPPVAPAAIPASLGTQPAALSAQPSVSPSPPPAPSVPTAARAIDASRTGGRQYRLTSQEVQLDVALAARRAEPTGLLCSGSVRFEEAPTATTPQPLLVEGEQLRVDGLEREFARLTVAGVADSRPMPEDKANPRAGLARFEARGMEMWARDLHVDQGANRVWVEGPGDARMQLTRKVGGALAGLEGEVTLRWAGGMEFNGARVALRGDVFAEATNDWVHCETLAATLDRPVDLRGGSSGGGAQVNVVEVECMGGVTIDHRSKDEGGQRSHERAQLATLRVNRATGAIAGQGPGWVRSVHLSDAQFSLGEPAAPAQQAAAPARLRFLRVNFNRGVDGNLNERALRFLEQVRAVYGPVLAWEQQLPIDQPGQMPPDVLRLEGDELRVYEDPAARYAAGAPTSSGNLGPVEMRVLGAVKIEGAASGGSQPFLAEAAAASYTQAKETFVLEGDAARDATIWLVHDPAAPPAKTVGRKLSYNRRDGRLKMEDWRGGTFDGAGRSGP
ncbi:MAG: hypothetical protein ACRCT8_07185 [Lacipirellulaceae bacterium]